MMLGRIARIVLLVSLAVFAVALVAVSGGHPATAQPTVAALSPSDRCTPVGGMLMTNFGGIDQASTMGTATGDLAGAVAGTVLGTPGPGVGGTVVFHVQHHWVTQSGDTLFFDPATATTLPLSQTFFAIVSYPIHLTGGTGRFNGATGDLNAIGEVDLSSGTVFRYSGKVCFE